MQALEQKWVLSCIDGSHISDAVADYSAWIAGKVNSPLELVHSIEHSMLLEHTSRSGNLTPNMREHLSKTLAEDEQKESKALIAAGKEMLEKAKQRVDGSALKEVITRQRHGGVAEAIKDLEDEIRVLVIGVRGEDHEQDETRIGAQIEETIRSLHRPIFIVNGDFKEPKSLMLAYNRSEGAEKALQMVAESPLYRDMDVHVVTASDKPSEAKALLDKAGDTLKAAGFDPTLAHLDGDAQQALLDYQNEHDLDMTVMGAFNHGKLRSLFFGSFTLKMLAHNRKPLLLIR
ncbi:universal stress protein [Thiomicrospira sp. WB1]|uniref:universal stress protein n=1 Tax=Thiomicrospira sp. WB1 TaxID=1685380 RepID=UPI0007483E4C|nr:universal stress protein [Thiomicrospira sp. WB1]KUJ71207.1 universal stress protein UspA [Thiomicrospira sp. WB1]